MKEARGWVLNDGSMQNALDWCSASLFDFQVVEAMNLVLHESPARLISVQSIFYIHHHRL